MSEEYESVSLVKNEVFVYRIPPLGSNRGYKAADWKLDCPDWTGRLRLVSVGKKLELRLEDKTTGELFAKAPVDKYPGIAIEPVTDSSRYFVVRLQDESGRNAFIGIGFADRGDSFDLNVALSDHFKYIEKDEKLSQEFAQEASKPKLDLGFKEGQTITINIGGKRTDGTTRPRPSGGVSGGPVPLLPPPPGGAGGRIPPPPPGPTGQRSLSPQEQPHSNVQQSSSTVSASSGGTTGSATSSNDLFSSLDPFISGSASASVSATSSSSGSNIDSLLAVAMAGVSVTAAARLRKDFIRLIKDPVPFVLAAPLSKNILEWHYVVKGPAQSPYEGGLYHGKLVFPPDFPFKPPSIYMLTPNGRFQTNTRLCLSISDYHPDTWNPAWTVSTILTGLLSFMKRALARKSRAYNLKNKCFCDLFPDLVKEVREELAKEAAELEAARAAGGGGRLEGENAANDQRLEGSGGIFDHSVTYNVLVLVGVVALAFAVRYVLISAAAGDDSNFSS